MRTSKTACFGSILSLLLLVVTMSTTSCSNEEDRAMARQIESRSELIGGPGALGEVGDFLLENDRIRVIVQDRGFSRGFGVYGGSLIDADLHRAVPAGGQTGGNGHDTFGELFPIFFLEALVPDNVEVLNDGTDGGTAIIRVSGTGGDFLTLVKVLNQVVLNSHEVDPAALLGGDPEAFDGEPKMSFETLYELDPGARFVRIRNRMTNLTDEPLPIPSQEGMTLLNLFLGGNIDLRVPIGQVLLFGAGNKVFAAQHGYDIRFGLEDAYEESVPFPALPGLISDAIISTNKDAGVSYGFIINPTTANFPRARTDPETRRNVYEQAYGVMPEPDDMLIPFLASAFTGVMYGQSPRELAPNGIAGDTFESLSFFIIGDGDVGSVMNTVYELREVETRQLAGIVRDERTRVPIEGASVLIFDRQTGGGINQFFTDARGQFVGEMPPGQYIARVEKDPVLSDPVVFDMAPERGEYLELSLPATSRILVNVKDDKGRQLPAKVTVVGTVDREIAGIAPRKALFDLAAGQRWRFTDFVPDDPDDPTTLRYVEATGYTRDGSIELEVPGGREYTVFVSRGVEYDLQAATVSVAPGAAERVSAVLTRVVDTTGYISADFHLHAAPSLDSDLSLDERVISAAGEGLEVAVATDHNFVTNYAPVIRRHQLEEWITSIIGLELTTLEGGHFNSFPIEYKPGEITRGSFEWSLRPPADIFDELRSRGTLPPEEMIIQVNHPRDTILGYFGQYDFSPLDGELDTTPGGITDIIAPNGPTFADPDTGESTFSLDFNAIEVLNGKRFDQIRHFRMPASIAGREIPAETVPLLPEPGTILCDGDGEVAYAGAVDDWFNLLNKGMRITGTGNSDSHGTEGEEPAYPRNYVFVGKDQPRDVTPAEIAAAVRNHRITMTNGPFVELFVEGQPIGSDVDKPGGEVAVEVRIQAPAWVSVDGGTLYVNGQPAETFEVTMERGRGRYETTLTLDRDSWILVEVTGPASLFPVVPPQEVPSVQISDAVASIAGPLGFGTGELGELATPALTHIVTPFALTNPIWVDTDGGGFDAPGVLPRQCADGEFGVTPKPDVEDSEQALRASDVKPRRDARLVESLWFPRVRGELHDVRLIFEQFAGHGHGH